MSKFSTKTAGTTVTKNLAGGHAYKQDIKTEFVAHILTSFMQSSFYRSEADATARLDELISGVSPEFAAKAALFARNEYGMRSVSHYVAARLAAGASGTQWGKRFYSNIIRRVDDMYEICAAYMQMNPKKGITNAMKKGFRTAFARFDGYQLAKYRGDGKSVSLVDVMRMTHPRASERNGDALRKLVYGELKSTDTWESKLSAAGQEEDVEDAKSSAWKELIESKKIGYFALLRNMRNIIQQAPEMLDAACELLVDEEAIKKSLVLPFRFSTALEELATIPGSTKAIKAISQAVDISLSNIPVMEGRTLVVLDVSSSMHGKPSTIGSLFAAALCKATTADLITFAGGAQYANVDVTSSTLSIANSIRFTGGSTNFESIFAVANAPYDRIFVLSDMQGWAETSYLYTRRGMATVFDEWCKRMECNPFLYSFDLNGYGTSKFPRNKVFLMAGFSEKIFEIIPMFEQSRDALVKRIEAVEL